MRKLLLIIAFISSVSSTFGQEIEFNGIFSSSSSKKFKNNFGYGVGYNQYIKSKNRLGISIERLFFNTPYDDIFGSSEDGISKYIVEIEPRNQRFEVRGSFAFRLIDNPKSKLFFGPEIGLNYFLIREQSERTANGNISEGHFSSDNLVKNRIGFGFLLEFEFKEIVFKRISTSISIHPGITSFEKFGLMGGNDPFIIGWLNFNLGIKYNLTK